MIGNKKMEKIFYTPSDKQLEDLKSIDAQIQALTAQKASYLRSMEAGVHTRTQGRKVIWDERYRLVEIPKLEETKS